jgi:plasmid stabilization system protein ParE
LTDYTPEARRQVRDLIAHYRRIRRPEAIGNLDAALARVEAAIARGPARPRTFPATYRDLARPGRGWLKEGIYWVAYQQTVPPVIIAVFWEQAEIDRRYPAML